MVGFFGPQSGGDDHQMVDHPRFRLNPLLAKYAQASGSPVQRIRPEQFMEIRDAAMGCCSTRLCFQAVQNLRSSAIRKLADLIGRQTAHAR